MAFYRNQHAVLIDENKQLKNQAASLQEGLEAANLEVDELSMTVRDQRTKIDEKSKYIEELANSLASIQAHQIDKVTMIKSHVDK